jgi:hypothetical protein
MAKIITFTGGLGAQILSASIYYYFRDIGEEIYADLNYFKQPESKAIIGTNAPSHWKYELGEYGIPIDQFETKKYYRFLKYLNRYDVIPDGAEKIRLALMALHNPKIKKLFEIPEQIIYECNDIIHNYNYLCIHIRRGDYLNVASRLVGENEYIDLAKSFADLVRQVIIISDSEPSVQFKNNLKIHFNNNCSYVIGGNVHVAHALMRKSKYLICSNSQYSLSAALLNDVAAQVFIPTNWFGNIHSDIQTELNKLCCFQICKGEIENDINQ